MFGLSKREQRWAAEQKATETLMPLITAVAVEAVKQDNEKDRLRQENEALRSLLNLYNLGGWTDALRTEAGRACSMLHQAMVGACNCGVKSREAPWHNGECFYRRLSEQADRLEVLLK